MWNNLKRNEAEECILNVNWTNYLCEMLRITGPTTLKA